MNCVPVAREIPEYEEYLEEEGFRKGKKAGIWHREKGERREVIDLTDPEEGVRAYAYKNEAQVDLNDELRSVKQKIEKLHA